MSTIRFVSRPCKHRHKTWQVVDLHSYNGNEVVCECASIESTARVVAALNSHQPYGRNMKKEEDPRYA